MRPVVSRTLSTSSTVAVPGGGTTKIRSRGISPSCSCMSGGGSNRSEIRKTCVKGGIGRRNGSHGRSLVRRVCQYGNTCHYTLPPAMGGSRGVRKVAGTVVLFTTGQDSGTGQRGLTLTANWMPDCLVLLPIPQMVDTRQSLTCPPWPAQKMKGQELWFIPVLFREGTGISVA